MIVVCGAATVCAVSWRTRFGHGPAYGEIPLAWAHDEDEAVRAVLEKNAFALTGWKVMSELPNPANFEAVTALVTPDQVRPKSTAVSPRPRRETGAAERHARSGMSGRGGRRAAVTGGKPIL